MRYERIKVKRDTQTTYNKEVAEWEVPILEFIFEQGNVERTGVFVKVTHTDYPDAPAEFDRLARVYGSDTENGVPYVGAVYGQSYAGIRALERAIDTARDDEVEADNEEPAPMPAPARRRSRRVAVDPLLS